VNEKLQIFLAGPPGSGKTSLGREACQRMGWSFLELPSTAAIDDLRDAVEQRTVDVIELPWELQQENRALNLVRQSGELVALWAHPLEMQERSGRDVQVCTPVKGLKTQGGFGREGTRCREFKRLDRSCDGVLMLGGVSFEESVKALVEFFEELATEVTAAPTEREGLGRWVQIYREDHHANKAAAEIFVDAVARYSIHLKELGRSPRSLSGIFSDLQAAGHLVFMYDTTLGRKVLGRFTLGAPWVGEFKRKFTDSPNLVRRYERSLDGFATFLRASGLVGEE
jgi:hypothetical protein